MLLKTFYNEVIANEIQCTQFLMAHGVILQVEQTQQTCIRCGSAMKDATRKNRNGESYAILRCVKFGCQTTASVRTGNEFLAYTDASGRTHGRLTLCEILELIMLWMIEMPLSKIAKATGRSGNTTVDWSNFFRKVCSQMVTVEKRGKMIGTVDEPIQIDEARFAGRRKNNKGRLLSGDMQVNLQDENAEVVNRRNHGRRIDGPWVFGLLKGKDVRYFYVKKRDAATLIPIILREVEPGSHINSDEWPAYNTLSRLGFHHSTVNHQRNYVDLRLGHILRE